MIIPIASRGNILHPVNRRRAHSPWFATFVPAMPRARYARRSLGQDASKLGWQSAGRVFTARKLIIAALVLLAGFGLGLHAADAAGPDGIAVSRAGKAANRVLSYLETGGERKLELVYKTTPEGDLHLDLYYPTPRPPGPCPVIVYTHGGGWAAGSKLGVGNALFAVVFKALVEKGFAVASVEYRLYKKDGAVFMRDCVIDSKDAVRYLAKHGESLGIDPLRVYVMGDSAGGQIAQVLLLSAPESLTGDPALADATYRMVAGVSWYGPCDFEKEDLFNHDDRPDFRDRFGPRILKPDSPPEARLARYREMSAVNYLTRTSPPLLMIQGDRDTTIPVKHAYYMRQRAEALQARVEILIVRNAGHNWREVGAKIVPPREEIVERTVRFFVDHLPSAPSQQSVGRKSRE